MGVLVLALGAPAGAAFGDDAGFDQKAALRASQDALGRPLGEHELVDRQGRPLRLERYRGKPLLLSMIYTRCSETCPVTTRYLGNAVRLMNEAFGADSFAVLSVGFDTDTDTPQAMQSFAVRQGIDLPNWEFASIDRKALGELARTLGFGFRASTMGFDHIAELAIVDADGRIYRKVYGDTFDLPLLGDPLKNLIGRGNMHYPLWQGLQRRIRLFCTVFDPATGRYRADYSFFAGMAISAAMVLPFGYWLLRELRRVWHLPGGDGQSGTA